MKLSVLTFRIIMFLVKHLGYSNLSYRIDIQEQGISVKIKFIHNSSEQSINKETLNNLSDYLTLDLIQSKSEVTETMVNELADEVDAAVWESLKSKYIKE
ncbi:hypothetical protein cce_0931 [Crocosphaera subtropica ATCC 51142]|uniref:Uncharacterized protein n=2 Tax=Crocosphaera TaxID=263510 RepID=B1WSV2_CROS5|nr:hypothetical protein cce_0931 [Crocosphaera subtropica ATCC 51142]